MLRPAPLPDKNAQAFHHGLPPGLPAQSFFLSVGDEEPALHLHTYAQCFVARCRNPQQSLLYRGQADRASRF